MKHFERPGKEYKLVWIDLRTDGNRKTIKLQSFHLSMAVNNAACRPEYRCLLIHHFTAFTDLSGVSQLHEDAEEIRQLCVRRRYILFPNT